YALPIWVPARVTVYSIEVSVMNVKQKSLEALVFFLGSSYPNVTEEDIVHNIRILKKTSWFNACLASEKGRQLIVHDEKVRYQLGQLSLKKLAKDPSDLYINEKVQKKVSHILKGRGNV